MQKPTPALLWSFMDSKNEYPTLFSGNFNIKECLKDCEWGSPHVQSRCQDYCTTRYKFENPQHNSPQLTLSENLEDYASHDSTDPLSLV